VAPGGKKAAVCEKSARRIGKITFANHCKMMQQFTYKMIEQIDIQTGRNRYE
jgi:hypothetical protein